MTIAASILALLKTRPDGVDDDELARILQLSARQQANSRCRMLEKEGVISRRHVNGKIRNFFVECVAPPESPEVEAIAPEQVRPWFWEGNVQDAIVRHLIANGYAIRSAANTATRQRGVDIVAERDGRQLWVSVKGYPNGTARTNPSLQASHWFKQVLFDVVVYRGRDNDLAIGVGLPDYRRYRDMSEKVTWFKSVGKFSYFWVRENGGVFVAQQVRDVDATGQFAALADNLTYALIDAAHQQLDVAHDAEPPREPDHPPAVLVGALRATRSGGRLRGTSSIMKSFGAYN